MICGLEGRFRSKLRHIEEIIGLSAGVASLAAMSLMITHRGPVFLADTHVQANPGAQAIASIAIACASQVQRFGITPKIAMVSHSDFGEDDTPSSLKMREATQIVHALCPQLEIDGEMQADSALSQAIRDRHLPSSTLKGEANVLVMPDLAAANLSFHMVKVFGDALPVGPILIGTAKPAHVLTGSVTSRGVVNMTAIAAAGETSPPIMTA
jgi:malate dehydrogenase (oxaloacetate-decarboxylating)(NADP+)